MPPTIEPSDTDCCCSAPEPVFCWAERIPMPPIELLMLTAPDAPGCPVVPPKRLCDTEPSILDEANIDTVRVLVVVWLRLPSPSTLFAPNVLITELEVEVRVLLMVLPKPVSVLLTEPPLVAAIPPGPPALAELSVVLVDVLVDVLVLPEPVVLYVLFAVLPFMALALPPVPVEVCAVLLVLVLLL